jgi:hypothetical protein
MLVIALVLFGLGGAAVYCLLQGVHETGRGGYSANPHAPTVARAAPPEPPKGPGGGSRPPTYETVEAELFDTLQAAEYRIPYEPPTTWPLLECDHEMEEVHVLGQVEPIAAWCVTCGRPGVHTHLRAGVPVDHNGIEHR